MNSQSLRDALIYLIDKYGRNTVEEELLDIEEESNEIDDDED